MQYTGPIFFAGIVLAVFLSSLRLPEHVGLLAFLATVALCLWLPLFLDWLQMQRELFEKKPAGSGPRMTLLQTMLILFGVSIELGAGMDILKSDLPLLSPLLFVVTPVIVMLALETLEVRGPFSKFRNGLRHRVCAGEVAEAPAPEAPAPEQPAPDNAAPPELSAEPATHALRTRMAVKRGRLAAGKEPAM